MNGLDHLQRHPPAHSYQRPIKQLLGELEAGCSLSEGIQRAGDWLPEFDIALLRAGEQSGRLEECFGLLADYYTERASLARQMIADLAYPVILLHVAIFIFPFAQLFLSGD